MSGSHNTHARLAPSASKCWTNCTAQPAYVASVAHLLPPEEDSPYAAEGTQAHDYAEEVLLGLSDIEGIPKEFRVPVGFYVDHCREVSAGALTQLVEVSVPLFYSEEDNGTCDFIAVVPQPDGSTTWVVRDYKHGAGVPVEAEQNTQLAIYAFSFLQQAFKGKIAGVPKPNPETDMVDVGIVQPRYHGDDPIKVWQVALLDLIQFCEEIKTTAAGIQNGDPGDFAPGDEVCRWCRAKTICDARRKWVTEPLLAGLPDGSSIEETEALLAETPELDKNEKKFPVVQRLDARGEDTDDKARLVAIWNNRKAITAWLDDIGEYLTQLALDGTPAPGTKLVMGRMGNRAWDDEEVADKLLSRKIKANERYTRRLINPTRAAEILNIETQSTKFKNKFDSLISRSEGKPTLAPASDKRESIGSPADSLPVG